jgi:hypothetical protein
MTSNSSLGQTLHTHGAVGLRGVVARSPAQGLVTAFLAAASVIGVAAADHDRVWIGLGGAGLVVLVLAGWYASGRSRDRIVLHERGFRWTRRDGTRDVRWTELIGLRIEHVDERQRRSFVTIPRDKFEISVEGDAPYRVDPRIREVRALTAQLERLAAPAMAERGQSHLDAGLTLLFGRAVVHRGGLAPQTDLLPWRDLAAIDGHDGRLTLVFETFGRYAIGRYGDIPAAYALVEICRRNAAAAGRTLRLPDPAARVERVRR